MIYNWYQLFDLSDFEAEGLVSKTLDVELEGLGRQEILITKGNTVAISYDDAFLPVNFLEMNPYENNGYAVYLDSNDKVHLGIPADE